MLSRTGIVGYLRTSFEIANKNDTGEYAGSITDGQYKLDVLVTKGDHDIDIVKGTKLDITGDLQESGIIILLRYFEKPEYILFNFQLTPSH